MNQPNTAAIFLILCAYCINFGPLGLGSCIWEVEFGQYFHFICQDPIPGKILSSFCVYQLCYTNPKTHDYISKTD